MTGFLLWLFTSNGEINIFIVKHFGFSNVLAMDYFFFFYFEIINTIHGVLKKFF